MFKSIKKVQRYQIAGIVVWIKTQLARLKN